MKKLFSYITDRYYLFGSLVFDLAALYFLAKEGAKVIVNDLGGNTDGTGGTQIADEVVEEIKSAAKSAKVSEDIERFKDEYQTLLGERGVTLSGGQIQRISIARALIKDPKILLFDDCLSAVDADTEEEILKNLKKRSKEKTTLIVSHRISSVMETDLIIVLDHGAIIEQGTHTELMDKGGFYKDLYLKQNRERDQ